MDTPPTSAAEAVAKSGSAPVEPNAPKAHSPGKKAGEPSSTPSATAEPKWVVAANVVLVAPKGPGYVAVGGHLAGLRKDMLVQVVGPPQSDGRRKVLGQATVKRKVLGGAGMLLDLSDEARAATGKRFVVVPGGRAAPEPVAEAPQPEAPQPEAPPAPAPEPPPMPEAPKPLNVFVRQKGLVDKELNIINRESSVLSRCKAVLDDKRTADIKSLKTGSNSVDVGLFQKKWVAPTVAKGHILIECAEGKAEVSIFRQ